MSSKNPAKLALLPEEDQRVNFWNFGRLKRASFIIYVDFKFILINLNC